MIPQLHAMAFFVLLVVAGWQDVRSRAVSPVLVYTGVAVSLSMRAMVGVEAHLEGLLGLLAALVIALVVVAIRAGGGSDLRLLLLVGAFLGARDTLTAVTVAAGVMLLGAALTALLQRGPWQGTRTARVLLTPYTGVGWSGGRVVVTTVEDAGAAARTAAVSPGLAIVVGAMAGWIL